MRRRTFLKLIAIFSGLLSSSLVLGQELLRIKQSEIQAKAKNASNEIIEAARKAAKDEGIELSEENIKQLRQHTFESYLSNVKEAGYEVYDP